MPENLKIEISVRMLEISRRETICIVVLTLAFTFFGTSILAVKCSEHYLDTAFLLRLTDNIAKTGRPMCQVIASSTYFFFEKNFLAMPAEKLCSDPIGLPKEADYNYFKFHPHPILYAFAPLVWLFPVSIVLSAAHSISFFGLLGLVYCFLRRLSTPIFLAIPFVLLVASHPAWSISYFGQYYVERYSVFLFALFLYLAYTSQRYFAFSIVVLLISLLSERTPLFMGMLTLVFVVLFHKVLKNNKRIVLLGFLMIGFGCLLIAMKSSDAKISIGSINWRHLLDPKALEDCYTFIFFNIFMLGCFSLFNWRALLLAITAMVPNLLIGIGGAEKSGWATHYHSLYFPVLVWSSALGYANFYTLMRKYKLCSPLVLASVVMLSTVCLGVDKYRPSFIEFYIHNYADFPFVRLFSEYEKYIGQGDAAVQKRMQYNTILAAIPEGSVVSMPEALMPLLSANRTIHYFPVGLEIADYVLLTGVVVKDNVFIKHSTMPSYLDIKEGEKINACLFNRMGELGFDLNHPLFFKDSGIAIIRRIAKNS